MLVPDNRRYLPSHEWCLLDGDEAVLGISDFAQDQLGDIVYVELPAVGATVTAGQPFGSIESVKAAEDLNSPLSGEVVAVNDAVVDAVDTINRDPYGAGWLLRIRPADLSEAASLLDAAAYTAACEAGH
ncbi:MAG: glycine cleavage system protein GcvH [Fimbriimonadaceae bacterium]|nr:glycine cleavage system protein GcvH [Fimbriimonadaceae bacterium]